MGTYGKKIVEVDVNQLIGMLNKAMSDEWLAYYQYWIGAKVVQGCKSELVVKELEEHAKEELEHAEMLAGRILQLGGTPILDPKKWFEETHCGYAEPKDFHSKAVLEQNIKGEQCAIDVYKKMLEFVKGKDHITFHMLLDILEDEVEHEDDLEKILEDIQVCHKSCK